MSRQWKTAAACGLKNFHHSMRHMEACFLQAELMTSKYSNDLWWATRCRCTHTPSPSLTCVLTAAFTLLPAAQLKESQQARGRRGRDWWWSWLCWQLAARLNGNGLLLNQQHSIDRALTCNVHTEQLWKTDWIFLIAMGYNDRSGSRNKKKLSEASLSQQHVLMFDLQISRK